MRLRKNIAIANEALLVVDQIIDRQLAGVKQVLFSMRLHARGACLEIFTTFLSFTIFDLCRSLRNYVNRRGLAELFSISSL